MKIWLTTWHGSTKEIQALKRAGYEIEQTSMHVKDAIEGDPFEIAKKIHATGSVKVAIGDEKLINGETSVVIAVSDDWFHQR